MTLAHLLPFFSYRGSLILLVSLYKLKAERFRLTRHTGRFTRHIIVNGRQFHAQTAGSFGYDYTLTDCWNQFPAFTIRYGIYRQRHLIEYISVKAELVAFLQRNKR